MAQVDVNICKKKKNNYVFTYFPFFILTAKGASVNWLADPIEGYRFVVIEEKTHFNHVFAFPRASVISGFERELFVPYDNLFKGDENVGKVVNARATAIHKTHVELDREVPEFGTTIDYEYLVYTAGTKIPAPGRLPITTKKEGIAMLKKYQELIKKSERPIIIGAGAVGLGKNRDNNNQMEMVSLTEFDFRARWRNQRTLS